MVIFGVFLAGNLILFLFSNHQRSNKQIKLIDESSRILRFNMICSGSFLGAIAFGLVLSKRWSFFVELIWGAMFISLFSSIFLERKYFSDSSQIKMKLTCTGWLLILWGTPSFYLVTDYITSIWRPFAIIGTWFFLTFYDFQKDQKQA